MVAHWGSLAAHKNNKQFITWSVGTTAENCDTVFYISYINEEPGLIATTQCFTYR